MGIGIIRSRLRKNARAMLSIFLIPLIIIMFASCEKKPEEETIQIKLMHGWGGSTKDHKAMQQIYKDFEIENKDIEIIFDASPDLPVVIDKANDMLATDKMPDIISTNGIGTFVSNAVIKGLALDLMPYINSDEEFKNNIDHRVLDAWQVDGAIYTIPDALEVIGYWYNEDIFRQAGITKDGTPSTEVMIPREWDEFWEACDKIQSWAQQNNIGVSPLEMDQDQITVFLGARIAGEGSEGLDFINSSPTNFNNEVFKTGIDDLIKAYSYSMHKSTEASKYNTRQLFIESKTAIYFNGVWENMGFSSANNKDNIKYAVYPGFNGKTLSYVSPSSGYVIGKSGDPRKVEACVRFLKYILSTEIQKRIVLETKQAPSNPNVRMEQINQDVPMLAMALETAYSADIHIRTLNSSWSELVISTLNSNVLKVVNDELSVEELIETLNNINK